MTHGRLGVVVVNYASAHLLEANLAPLTGPSDRIRVVVVDNFSSDEERSATERLAAAHGWDLVALPDNRGFAAGVNAGIRAARREGCVCFLLLNPDASVDADVAEDLRRQVLEQPLTLVSPLVLSSGGEVFFDGSRLLLDDGRVRGRRSADPRSGPSCEWLSGACLAVHEELLDRIGGLDESYFLYWEDVEFSHRARAAGATLVVRRDLVAVHDSGGTQGATPGRAKSDLYYRYNCINRLRFAAQHLPRAAVFRWMLTTPAVSWEILRRGGRRQVLTHPGALLAAVGGSWTGLRIAAAALIRGPARPSPPAPSVTPRALAPAAPTVPDVLTGGRG